MLYSCVSAPLHVEHYLPDDADIYIRAELTESDVLVPLFQERGFPLRHLDKITAIYVALDAPHETMVILHRAPPFFIRKEFRKKIPGISGKPLTLMVNEPGVAVLGSAPVMSSVDPSRLRTLESSSFTVIRTFSEGEAGSPFLKSLIIRFDDTQRLKVELMPGDNKVARTMLRSLLAFTSEITYLEGVTLFPVFTDDEAILLESEPMQSDEFFRVVYSFIFS